MNQSAAVSVIVAGISIILCAVNLVQTVTPNVPFTLDCASFSFSYYIYIFGICVVYQFAKVLTVFKMFASVVVVRHKGKNVET